MVAVLASWLAWARVKPFISGEDAPNRSENFYKVLRWSIAIFCPILVITVLVTGI